MPTAPRHPGSAVLWSAATVLLAAASAPASPPVPAAAPPADPARKSDGPGPVAAAPRLNVLWISVEDMSPDLGCYGDAYARTPNIDKFATQSVRYTRAYTYAGVCAPSRSSIITGCYPCSIGTHHMRCKGVPPAVVKCFPEYLRAAGWWCTNNVKTDYNFDAPLTAWDENSNKAHWRNRPDKSQPFFSVFNITTTHESQIRAPEAAYQNRIKSLPADMIHDPAKAVLPPYYPDTPIVRKDWARYHDNISVMDGQMAAILKQLEDDGLAGNTVVFFWADHGRGLPRCKRWLYDGGTHVPLMIRWPDGRGKGTTDDRLLSLMDLGPTVLSLAGIATPAHMHGKAFLGAHAAPPRQYVHGARDRMDETYDIIRTTRDARFRYIRNLQPEKPYTQHIAYMEEMPTMQELRRLYKESISGGVWDWKLPPAARDWFAPTKPVEELYDGDADPHNVTNLAADPKFDAELKRLRAETDRWMKEIGDLAMENEKALWEKMRPGGKWSVTAAPVVTSEKTRGGGTAVHVTCPTEGASIAWTTGEGADARWKLVAGPIVLPAGEGAKLRLRACRIGFRDSPEVVVSPDGTTEVVPVVGPGPKGKAKKAKTDRE